MIRASRGAAVLTLTWLILAGWFWSTASPAAQIRAGINYATGVIAFLTTPSSANFFSAITNETGSGLVVGATAPTFTKLTSEIASIGTTSFASASDAAVFSNSTAATALATVQASPNLRFTGAGWISSANKTCDVVQTYDPATSNGIDSRPGGYFKWNSNCTGDSSPQEMMRLSNNGNLLIGSGLDAGYAHELGLAGFVQGDVSASYNGAFYWRGQSSPTNPSRVVMNSTARGLLDIYESDQGVSRIEFNIGTAKPTLSSCGTGAISGGASNVVGSFTTTGASSCTLNFGSPNWTSTPICLAQDISTGKATTVTALSASAYTFSGFTSGSTIAYICIRSA